MEKVEINSTAQSAEENLGASKFKKSHSLRFEKRVVRTLTGAELKLAAGGTVCTFMSIFGGTVTHTKE